MSTTPSAPTPIATPYPVREFTDNGAKTAKKTGEKTTSTVSTNINFFVKTGSGASAETVPGLSFTPREYGGKELAKARSMAESVSDRVSVMTTLADPYFNPDPKSFSCRTEFMQVRGARLETFFDQALRRSDLSLGAVQELNIQHSDVYRGQKHIFDNAQTDTYWSNTRATIEYTDGTSEPGDMQTFVPVFEKFRDALPEDAVEERNTFQKQIDYIYTNKYTPTGKVNEKDCEVSLGLVAIDQVTRERIHFSDHTRTESGAAVTKVVFRPAKAGESPRSGFKFDWNNNRQLDAKAHDTSWWGHCDIKAIIEAVHADMQASKGVTTYDATTKATTIASRAEQLQALAALLNMGRTYTSNGSDGIRGAGKTEFAGSRFDDEPSMIVFQTAAGNISCPIKLTALSQKGTGVAETDMGAVFMTNRPVKLAGSDNAYTFEKNSEVNHGGPVDGDFNFIPGAKRSLTGTIEKTGRTITIDPNNPAAPSVTLQTADGRSVVYDPRTKAISVNGASRGVTAGMWIGHELKKGDGIADKEKLIAKAISTGQVLCTDGDTTAEVWNGKIAGEAKGIEITTLWRSADRKTEVVQTRIESEFSSGAMEYGRLIIQRNERFEITGYCELEANSDFLFTDTPEIAPFIIKDGVKHWNQALVNRGMLQLGTSAKAQKSQTACIALFDGLISMIHLGLTAKVGDAVTHRVKYVDPGTKKPVMLEYTDKAKWQEAVAKIKKRGGDMTPEPATPTPATPVMPKTGRHWAKARNTVAAAAAFKEAKASTPASRPNAAQRLWKKATCCSCGSKKSTEQYS